ncbi:carbon-nitrogen hydrolase family protein [Peribacillus kribbensis]|uniref:carbon-nitrogen hydrolase family protein n=1 Tax=Peribacillus kribbensis TaxID=356658 RepID=UPI000479510F|nr:carbon-nitrogen hydrolase family protein [Peribacillus kribbensis]
MLLFNTALLISEDGKIAGTYQKTHLNKSDKTWASEGSSLPVFKTDSLGTVGILIGEAAAYPESAGVLAVKRADVIAIPSAWNGQYGGEMEINKKLSANPYPDGSMVTWNAVAIGTQANTVAANYVGNQEKYLGRSSLYIRSTLWTRSACNSFS